MKSLLFATLLVTSFSSAHGASLKGEEGWYCQSRITSRSQDYTSFRLGKVFEYAARDSVTRNFVETSNVVFRGQSYTNRNLPVLNLRINGELNSKKGLSVILYTTDIWIELKGSKGSSEINGTIEVGGLKKVNVSCEPAPFS